MSLGLAMAIPPARAPRPPPLLEVRIQRPADEQLELARAAQRGDQRARDRLYRLHERLIHHCLRRWRGRGEYDELVQEGALGLLEAIGTFDGRRPFAWWATKHINQATVLYLRRGQTRRAQIISSDAVEVDELLGLAGAQDLEQELLAGERRALVRRVAQTAHGRIADAFRYRLLSENPESLAKLGQRWGVGPTIAAAVERRALLWLRKRLLELERDP